MRGHSEDAVLELIPALASMLRQGDSADLVIALSVELSGTGHESISPLVSVADLTTEQRKPRKMELARDLGSEDAGQNQEKCCGQSLDSVHEIELHGQ